MTFCPLMLEFLQPLFGNGLKGIVRCVGTFADFFDEARINTLCKLLFCLLGAFSRKKPAILVELRA
jgi:hypothetical protein